LQKWRVWTAGCLLAGAFGVICVSSAVAEDAPAGGIVAPSIATSLPADGDPSGMRKQLGDNGISYSFVYTGELLGNVSGGVRRGSIYEGKLEGLLNIDFDKLSGWKGLNLFANGFQIHRTRGLRDDHFESLITVSNIEAVSSTRLSEIWLEQKLLGDKISVRIGQLAADAEFFISDYARMFVSNDWPTILGANLPSGGPAYPLSTPGVRLKFNPHEHWSLLVGIFNGDPGNQATVNRHGTNFRVNDPPLVMAELQFRFNQDKEASGLAGILRLGGWYHFGEFDDQRFDDLGLSLAAPLSSGTARRLSQTNGIYGIFDQQIYRPTGGGPDSGVSVFGRVGGTQSDRNLVDLFFDTGIVAAGMIPGRPDDKFGASLIFAGISESARALDTDAIAFGALQPVRNYEMLLEVSYQAQIRPGWVVQPLFQYVFNPGGSVPAASGSGWQVRSGALLGLRSSIVY
jgi:porin